MNGMTNIINTLGFSDDKIQKCCDSKGLLSIELEFTKKCNLKCLYCYTAAGKATENELTVDELKSIVLQAKNLGAKKIILLGGGEPLIYDKIIDIIQYISSLGLKQVIFTNGTLINDEMANVLLDNKVSVIVKHNSFKPEVQDSLSGIPGTFSKIKEGIKKLREVGYPHGEVSLGIQTIICKQNFDEIPDMWAWARERNIIPYVEVITLQGRAKDNSSLMVSSARVKSLFEQLKSIDHSNGIKWENSSTIAAFSCKRHLYSCLVNAQGYVQPCTGVDILVGNIREKPIKEILATSNVVKRLRNVYHNLEGQCRDCDHSKECYGCRGNAYQITGNYLASDPTCWHCDQVNNENPAYLG